MMPLHTVASNSSAYNVRSPSRVVTKNSVASGANILVTSTGCYVTCLKLVAVRKHLPVLNQLLWSALVCLISMLGKQ